MTDGVVKDCSVCLAGNSPVGRFVVATVAWYVGDRAGIDEDHRSWIDDPTENGTLSAIHAALDEYGRPRT